MAKYRLKALATNVVPEGAYALKVASLKEETFESGSWGFKARYVVAAATDPDLIGKSVFENLIVHDKDGGISKGIFKPAQLLTAVHGEDIEVDLEDRQEVIAFMDATVDKMFVADIELLAKDEKQGLPERNNIKSYAPYQEAA